MTAKDNDITERLKEWQAGEELALESLYPLVQSELQKLARSFLRRERTNHTLQTTALVHEAYMRLVKAKQVDWQSRAHFFSISARIMREILVDHARHRNYEKRGGGARKISLDEVPEVPQSVDEDLVELDEALCELAGLDQRKSKVVELRFFGGLDIDETADILGVSRDTVKRDWRLAKAWLRVRLLPEAGSGT